MRLRPLPISELSETGFLPDELHECSLAAIVNDLVDAIRDSVSIDRSKKESVRAKMRSKIKRSLRKHGYPPDKQEAAVITVIDQAEVVCREWGEVA